MTGDLGTIMAQIDIQRASLYSKVRWRLIPTPDGWVAFERLLNVDQLVRLGTIGPMPKRKRCV